MRAVGQDLVELIKGDLAVAVGVRLFDHLLQVLVVKTHVVAGRDPSEPCHRDVAYLFVVEQLEHLKNIGLLLLAGHVGAKELHELLEIDAASALSVDVADELVEGVRYCFGTLFLDGLLDVCVDWRVPFG